MEAAKRTTERLRLSPSPLRPTIQPCRVMALDGGALSFTDLFFHTRNSPRMPRRSDAAATTDPAWLAAYAERGWAVTALDPAAAVVDHISLITTPPDGRYSPLGAPAPAAVGKHQQQRRQQQGESEEGASDEGLVRALVFPLDADVDAASLEVQLAGFLPAGDIQLFSRPMQLQQGSGGSGLLFSVLAETTVSCVGAAGDPAANCHPPAEQVLIQVSLAWQIECWSYGRAVQLAAGWDVALIS